MTPGRWFRLDVGWSRSEWLAELEPASRLAWVELLAYVKAEGVGGVAKAMSPAVFGRIAGIDPADVRALLDAAEADGALEIHDGEWRVTKWDAFQNPDRTAAERMRRHREKQDVTRNTRNDTRNKGVTRHATVTVTETETETTEEQIGAAEAAEPKKSKRWKFVPDDWRPTEKHAELAVELGVDLTTQVALFRDHEFKEPKSDADRAFNRWLRTSVTLTPRRNGQSADRDLLEHRQRLESIDLNGSRSALYD